MRGWSGRCCDRKGRGEDADLILNWFCLKAVGWTWRRRERGGQVALHLFDWLVLVVLLAVHDQLGEIAVVELPLIDRGAVEQLVHLLVGPPITHRSHQLSKAVLIDHPWKDEESR